MFKNYLKLAIKVLGRRKFYTFVSLFGISFTLMVLMVIMAFLDTELGANPPMSKADRMILVDRISFKTQYYDTIYQLDSNLIDNVMVYDTVNFETEESGSSNSNGSPGIKVFQEHLVKAEPYENATVMFDRNFDVFQDNRKYTMNAMFADAEYWEVLNFEFLAGGPFNREHEASAQSVAVVTDRLAGEFFGTTEDIVGREILLSGRTYTIIGMVARPRSSSQYSRADLYLPLSTGDAQTIGSESFQGPFRAIYVAPSTAEVKILQDNLLFLGKNLPIPVDMANYETVNIRAFTPEERYAYSVLNGEDTKKTRNQFRLIVFLTLGFFLLIPTLNLINLNLSRMMERASEISVRKAFGADSRHILTQFLFENVIITLIGGVIGFLMALVVIHLINSSEILPNSLLSFNWRVFALSLTVCLGFGFLSGLLPAYRMSRQNIASGL